MGASIQPYRGRMEMFVSKTQRVPLRWQENGTFLGFPCVLGLPAVGPGPGPSDVGTDEHTAPFLPVPQ